MVGSLNFRMISTIFEPKGDMIDKISFSFTINTFVLEKKTNNFFLFFKICTLFFITSFWNSSSLNLNKIDSGNENEFL